MSKFCLIVCFLASANCLQGQSSIIPIQYDSLPSIRSFRQQLPLLDKIRCATYLFARHFTVKDSLGNIYISLYYDKDNQETIPAWLYSITTALFNVTNLYALNPVRDYAKQVYQYLIIDAYDKNGKIIFDKYFEIQKYNYHESKNLMKPLLERIRLPNTWRINKDTCEIIYYCSDPEERKIFYKPLLLLLLQLGQMDKKCTIWKEYYPDCFELTFCESAIINLPI